MLAGGQSNPFIQFKKPALLTCNEGEDLINRDINQEISNTLHQNFNQRNFIGNFRRMKPKTAKYRHRTNFQSRKASSNIETEYGQTNGSRVPISVKMQAGNTGSEGGKNINNSNQDHTPMKNSQIINDSRQFLHSPKIMQPKQLTLPPFFSDMDASNQFIAKSNGQKQRVHQLPYHRNES